MSTSKKVMAVLKACPVFADLPEVELRQVAGLGQCVTVPADELLLSQGDVADALYVLAVGRAEVYCADELNQKTVLTELGPHECFGEMSYFSGALRSASVQAKVECRLVRIAYSDLKLALRSSAELNRKFLDIISERLRHTNMRMQATSSHARRVERALESLRDIVDMSDVLDMRLDIEGLIRQVVHSASQVLSAERASLFLLDPITGDLWSKVVEGEGTREIRIPAGTGVAGWVATHGELQNIADAYDDERFNRDIDVSTGYRTRSILCGPVKNLQGEVIGVIQVINKRSGEGQPAAEFTAEDEALFRAFAYQTAITVENFRLYQRMVSSQQKMVLMLDVATSVGQTLDLDLLMDRIVVKITEVLEADRSTLFLVDHASNELWAKKAQGAEVEEIRFPLSSGLAGHVATTGDVLNIDDAYEDPRFNQAFDKSTGFRTHSMLCCPVKNRDGEVIGVTQVMNKHVGGHGEIGPFGQDDIELLLALSAQIAVALQNAKLYESTRAMKNYLESVQESISNSIITLDNHWRIQTVNRAAASLLEVDAEGLVGQNLRELIGEANPGVISAIENIYINRKMLVEYDVTLQMPDRQEHSLNVNYLPLLDHEGKNLGVIAVFEDITREKRVKSTLTRYMSKDIVDRLLSDPSRQGLGGSSSNATILFSDIRSFTGISELYTAEQLVEFLNGYFSAMVETVFTHKGVLDKYIGDALMAVFGVPYEQPDDASRAVSAALDMIKALEGLNSIRVGGGEEEISIGIGISSGKIVSGNVGSEKRMEFTVIGDDVNIASRLEGLTKFYGVPLIISEGTQAGLSDKFLVRPLDCVQVKGKKRAVEIFEVMGRKGDKISLDVEGYLIGYHAYRNGDFAGAAKALAGLVEQDPVSRLLSQRSEELLRNPDESWDGVWAWDAK